MILAWLLGRDRGERATLTPETLLYGDPEQVAVPFLGLAPRRGDEPVRNQMTEVLLDDGSDAE